MIEEHEIEMKYEPEYGYAESWGSKESFLYTIIKLSNSTGKPLPTQDIVAPQSHTIV